MREGKGEMEEKREWRRGREMRKRKGNGEGEKGRKKSKREGKRGNREGKRSSWERNARELYPPLYLPPQQTSSKFARASESCKIYPFFICGFWEKNMILKKRGGGAKIRVSQLIFTPELTSIQLYSHRK